MAQRVNTFPVDWAVLRAATDNDKAAMKEVISIYLDQGVKSVKALRSAVARDDAEQVVALAHRFLGSSRFVGATKIGVPLAALMKMGRTHRLHSTGVRLVNQTEKEFIRLDRYFNAPHE